MAANGDLIDFEVIEGSKENIQSLPGGRSAKQLSLLLSPLQDRSLSLDAPFTQTQELKATIRSEFEKELESIEEADDPLEVYDRYVKWTTNAYPTAQATPESGLLPLLERATKSLLSNGMYKNDPRYLKIWLLYIKLFSDSPRETYAFLSRNDIGEGLALYYEEFAAWLETQGHWTQAEEVYCVGVDKEARPKERLLRKYAEFQHRREAKTTDGEGPSSPALPKMRPALAPRTDPFSAEEVDPQAADRVQVPKKSVKAKMAIFSDSESPAENAPKSGPSWDSIGSIADRKKENTREPTSWVGEKLDGGKKLAGPKMSIFRDASLAKLESESNSNTFPGLERINIDAKGVRCFVFSNLEAIYPNGAGPETEELSFEELRARRRGWMEKSWDTPLRPIEALVKQREVESTCHLNLLNSDDHGSSQPIQNSLIDLSDENRPPNAVSKMIPLKGSPGAATRRKREEKANKTRKIKIVQVEIKQETQTVQLNLDSPSGPKKIRKMKPEATMTIHTKEAMDDVYDIFNQPLNPQGSIEKEIEHESEEEDDDYTSAGESTGTGQMSVCASEYGDETTGDFTTSSRIDGDVDSVTQNTVSDTDFSDFSNTNTSGIVDEIDSDEEDLSKVSVSPEGIVNNEPKDDMTPTSPGPDFFDQEDDVGELQEYNTLPYRTGKAVGRLPFMTPIVEKTESSLGALTNAADRSYACLKTPSRQNNQGPMPDIDDEDETGPLSSPFQETTEPDVGMRNRIAQPALTKIVESDNKGPLVLDSQCNPIDPGIRNLILDKLSPPLSTYTGYSDQRGSSANMGSKIRKYTKIVSEKRIGETAAVPPQLEFSKSKRTYTIRRELGRGAFAPVYLVDSHSREEEREYGVQRSSQEVLKMEDPPTPWEFYIIRQAHRRIGISRPSQSIVSVHEMHLYDDECYLFEDYRNQGTLLDAINLCRADNSGMDEQLAMFFVIEILRTVEAFHTKGLIHGDLKPDNILIRLDDYNSESWDSQYQRDGSHGWSAKGVLLIDFGRGIDMRVFKPDVQFIADWKTSEGDCAEMREMRPWTYQVDYHGLAGTIHSLLFGKYMEIMSEKGASIGAGATKTYKIKEGLKRYWQTEIWSEVFDVLLNPLTHIEDDGCLPVVSKLGKLRESMESHLTTNCEKGVGLKPLIRRLENGLREKKR